MRASGKVLPVSGISDGGFFERRVIPLLRVYTFSYPKARYSLYIVVVKSKSEYREFVQHSRFRLLIIQFIYTRMDVGEEEGSTRSRVIV